MCDDDAPMCEVWCVCVYCRPCSTFRLLVFTNSRVWCSHARQVHDMLHVQRVPQPHTHRDICICNYLLRCHTLLSVPRQRLSVAQAKDRCVVVSGVGLNCLHYLETITTKTEQHSRLSSLASSAVYLLEHVRISDTFSKSDSTGNSIKTYIHIRA